MPSLSPWLKFLDEVCTKRSFRVGYLDRQRSCLQTSKIVTAVTLLVCLYTRSVGVSYFAVGALACVLSSKIVKRTVREQRPVHGRKTTYGYVPPGTPSRLVCLIIGLSSMPSTHASGCTFFAVSILLGSMYLPLHDSLHPLAVFAPLVVIPWTSMILLSRVRLGYHTWPQVAGGVCFGVCFASLWFRIWAEDIGGIRTVGREMERQVH
ncbi:hypothetical protein J3R83DRAFT_2029, partial [Lanmaoa asiatica]